MAKKAAKTGKAMKGDRDKRLKIHADPETALRALLKTRKPSPKK